MDAFAHSASELDRVQRANELVNNIAIYLYSELRIAMASPENLGGHQTVSFNYNFEDESSTDYTLAEPEHNEFNRTTPYGLTEDTVSGEDSGNGNGNGNRNRNGR